MTTNVPEESVDIEALNHSESVPWNCHLFFNSFPRGDGCNHSSKVPASLAPSVLIGHSSQGLIQTGARLINGLLQVFFSVGKHLNTWFMMDFYDGCLWH